METILSKACYCVEERKICNSEHLKNRVIQLLEYGYHLGLEESRNVYRPFHNLDLLDALFCMYDVTAIFPKYCNENYDVYIRDLLHRIHFTGLSRSDTEDFFVIKVSDLELCRQKSKECGDKEDLLREFIITSNYTNRLRKMIPNFHYNFSGLKVSSPKFRSEHKEEITTCLALCPCDTGNSLDYILFEKLNGITLKDALKQSNVTVNDFLSWISQILLALDLAKTCFNFCHNNLIPENIYLRKITKDWIWKQEGEKSYLAYFHKNKIYYVKAKSIAVLVNFDFSRVEGVEIEGYETKGIFKDESRPFYDIYKLLMWSLRILQQSNRELFFKVRKIAKFFGLEYQKELDILLDREEKFDYIYSLEITDLERSRSIGDLLNFMFEQFPEMKNIMIDHEEFFEQPKIVNSKTLTSRDGFSQKLNYFTDLRDIISVYDGIKYRKRELRQLNAKLCEVERDNLCNFNTMELKMIEEELNGFKSMVEENKLTLQNREMDRIGDYIKETNRLIALNNLHLKNYKETYLNQINPYKNNLILNCSTDEECKKLLDHYRTEEEKYKFKFITQEIWEKSNIVRDRLYIEFRKQIIMEDLKVLIDFEHNFELEPISRSDFNLSPLEDLCL